MNNNHFDILIIGGGSAGYAAARTAASFDKKVGIVDGAKELGGLCILKGCMPSKTLIYSAELLWHAKQGSKFGLKIKDPQVAMDRLQNRKNMIVNEFAEYRKNQLNEDRFTLFRSNAKFQDNQNIVLENGTPLSADKFIISTGSTVQTPPIPGLRETPHWTSDDILNLDKLPESVIVLGGGVIAIELAQFLNRLGSKVTLLQRNSFLVKEYSNAISEEIKKALESEGIEIYTGCRFNQINSTKDGYSVNLTLGKENRTIHGKNLFNALGRKPNIDSLALENAEIEVLPSGHIKTNEDQLTTNPNVYACGDCSGPHEIVHIAIKQGEHAAKHALGMKSIPVHYENLLTVIFTDPQIAAIGLCEKQLHEKGIHYLEAVYPFNDHGKSILMNATFGFVKIYADPKDGTLLGAECVGKEASELIHSMSVAITLKAKASELLKANWYHPTLSEIWEYPLEELADNCELNLNQSNLEN